MIPYDFLEEATASIASNHKAAGVRRELYAHFLMKVEDLIAEGIDAEVAQERALESLGDPKEIADGYRPAYAVATESHLSRWYLLAGLPLIIAAVAAVNRPSYAIVWFVLSTALAWMLAQGKTWQQRTQALVDLFRETPLLWAVGLLGGAAAAIGRATASSENGVLFLLEFLLPWLAFLLFRWRERDLAQKANAFHLTWVVATAFLIAGGLVTILTHLNGSPALGYGYLGSVPTIGVLFLPLSLLGLSYLWNWVHSASLERFPLIILRRSKADS